ncbi:hypothetical protein [Roseobacter weihaiensis]|uniref:hypothetical protein n=1 Tax=Roseobacter weihaiensis TaxID=2763262 RepID=UPI001D0B3A3A|nr:hypothetical protein [Roseobacter sp. H9]
MTPPSYTLADIRRHSAFPFSDWRTEDFEFLMLELYWAERVRAVLGEDMAGFAPLYDAERDGNPILSVTHSGSLRGLRLVVNENDDAKPVYPEATGPGAFYPLYAFLNSGRLPDGETPVNELVLLVSLDERVSEHVDAFIRWHCIEGKSVDEMEALLLKYETDFGQIDSDAEFSDE